MKCLSIRQPWAWFIFNSGKDVENRDWKYRCPVRGNVLIHASSTMTQREYKEAIAFAKSIGVTMLPQFEQLKRGGIVGMVEITGHVRASKSPWFCGPTALTLARPYPLPFEPYPGQLGFFDKT